MTANPALAPARRRAIVAAQVQAQKEVKEAATAPPPTPTRRKVKGKLSLKNV
jgi:hypothetical protein